MRLVESDPRWKALYESAAAELRACLRERLHAIEHIGSTAIPGLRAKPILDLMVAVNGLPVGEDIHRDLNVIGYRHRELDPVPGRQFFVKGPVSAQTHYLSLCEPSSEFWFSHLAFRDALRADQGLSEQYGSLKRQLAERFSQDRPRYTAAKTQFIQSVIAPRS